MAFIGRGKYLCKARTGSDSDYPVVLQSVKSLRTQRKCSAQTCETPCLYHPNYYDWKGRTLPAGLREPNPDELKFLEKV